MIDFCSRSRNRQDKKGAAMNTASHVKSAVTNFNGSGRAPVKKNDGVSGGLSESRKARLRRNVPSELRDANAWLGFEYETRPGLKRRKKVPIDPETGVRADAKDGGSWGTFEQALVACERRRLDGIGYALMSADNITGVDLDNCREPRTGEIAEWAQEIISQLDSYTEVTVSGTGLRVFVQGKWPYDGHLVGKLGVHGEGHLEIYSEWFFAVTGDHLQGTPRKIERRADVISRLHSRFFASSQSSCSSTIRTVRTTIDNDDALIEKACSAENGDKFQRLWEGDWEADYESQSEADIALCGQLAFWTNCDAERMDTLFRRSGLFRPKWDEKHFANGETYGEHTIRIASENSTATYGADSGKTSPPTHGGASVCIADVESHPVKWLWRRWIPRGKLTIMEGDPGVAKSLLTLHLAACITNGSPLSDGSYCERGSVVIVNAEDGLEDTVKPRLEVAGADISRCHWLNFSLEDGQQTLVIPNQMDALKKKIEECKAVLVIIDPVVAYLEKRINSWNDQDVRRAMAPLSQLAQQTGAAIVLIRHLNKKEDVKNKMYRGGGSIGFIAAARSGLLVALDSHDSTLRVLSHNKANLSGAPTPLLFGVESVEYHAADEGMPKIVWHGEQSQAVAHPASSNLHKESSALEDAKEFLRESLGQRPQKSTQLYRDAHDSKISLSTLRRAKTALKVKSVRDGFGDEGVWFWKLPPTG
jgi:putative DNA primase/helicase